MAQKYIDSMIHHKITTKLATAKPNLSATIKKQKISFEKLAKLANVCSATVRAVLGGENIQLAKAEEIAKALGVAVSSVFEIKIETKYPTTSTVAKHFRTLRAILSVAKKQQIIKENYAKSEFVTQVKEKKKPIICLDDSDSHILAQGLWNEPDIRKKTSLLMLLQTGVRRGELCGLEWSDIDLEKSEMKIVRSSTAVAGMGVITKEPKTETSAREIALPTSLVKQLEEYKAWWNNYTTLLGDRYDGCNRLFLQEDGKPLYPSTLRYWLKLTTQKLGLPDVNVHSLRHTNITMQLIAGVPIKTVSVRAGHSSTKVTADVYSHFIKSSDKEAANKIEQLFGNN
ncbi:MAG: site-specific integrase [Clostridia bacterium]